MIIYVDIVFLLNVFLDFLLLMGVSVILTRNVKVKKLIIGSLIGGGSTLLLFVNISSLESILLKFILGLIMVLATFGYCSLKYTLNNLFYLYTISFSIGGVMYLLMDYGYYNYIVLILGFIVVLYFYIKEIKEYQANYVNYYKVIVYIKNKKYQLTGYLDTGNKLYDSFKHPVIIVSKNISYQDEDIIYVPYVSLNNNGVIKCIKTNKIIINKKVFNNYLVGLSKDKITIDGVNCILHSKMKGMI